MCSYKKFVLLITSLRLVDSVTLDEVFVHQGVNTVKGFHIISTLPSF